MTSHTQAYGELIRVRSGDNAGAETLRRVPLGAGSADGGISEDELEDLLFRYPQTLPIAAIDASYADAAPICRQLSLPAGFPDALLVNHLGRLTLVEFKLWRNPQARREVIGQILDYAKDLAAWGYEDLQRQVSLALRQSGNVLYDRVREHHRNLGPGENRELDEAQFVDNVTRHLQRGEFLLLIVGDGIRGQAANIIDFVQSHSGLHFNLAMVEAALYRDADDSLIIQPRILARTEIVQRFVVDAGSVVEANATGIDDRERQEVHSDEDEDNLSFWTEVLRNFSFSDATVSAPDPVIDTTLYVKVRNSAFNGWALCFGGYLHRREGEIGCYLTVRSNQEREVRMYNELKASFDELQKSLDGLEQWSAGKNPRIGFRRQMNLAFLAQGAESEDFRDAVEWMRQSLDRLVSSLHPRLQSMLADQR